MDILFIADPLSRFKIYKDTTYAMMAEAARRHGSSSPMEWRVRHRDGDGKRRRERRVRREPISSTGHRAR